MRRAAVAASILAGAAVATGAAALALHGSPSAPARMSGGSSLPPPARPAFVSGRGRGLGSTRNLSHWAPVRHATVARASPDPGAPVVGPVPARTPEGTDDVVAVLGRAADRDGGRWVRVGLAVLPNGTTGWVPRRALGGYETVRTRLIVDLADQQATLLRDGRAILRAPVGVGTPAAPTPRGTFLVRDRLTRYRSPAYGPIAFGTSARSPTVTDWPAGGFVGIHGTDQPGLLPGRVSHGCIRLRNPDILALARRMPVGTPVEIR
jgi:lipoprotein-anchoring transpeptidase ErfK/SrfK